MTLRPRFAGDGRLLLPSWITVVRARRSDASPGDVFSDFASGDIDPFERDADGLLLAEAFARFDLTRPRKARDWYAAHGAVALGSLFPDDIWHPDELVEGIDQSHDTLDEILAQQRLVRWHMTSLARLTEHREGAQPPAPDWSAHEGWDLTWSMAVIEGPGEAIWVGAPSDARGHITDEMKRYPRFEDVPGSPSLDDYHLEGMSRREFTEVWWPQAYEAWEHITSAGLPRLWVPRPGWSEYWGAEYEIDRLEPHGRGRYERLSTDWHGLLELQRRLIEPFVQRAAAFHVEVAREGGLAMPEGGGPPVLDFEQELLIRERRSWRSILAPIYLQLLEGLRRLSEGKPGASWCRECGEPFLRLDARRSMFCTDRERLRYAQRDRRQRIASEMVGET